MNDVETQVYAVLLKGHHWFSVDDIVFELEDSPSLLMRSKAHEACVFLHDKGLVDRKFTDGVRHFFYRALSPHEIAESKMKGVSLDSSHDDLERKVYELLLSANARGGFEWQNPGRIARKTGVEIKDIIESCKNLSIKGLVEDDGDKTLPFFRALSPHEIICKKKKH